MENDTDYLQQTIDRLEQELAKEKKLRLEERAGRTTAEKHLRDELNRKVADCDTGYSFKPIGRIESCFMDRRGTPRQSGLMPHSKARIRISSICPTTFDSLEQFSHIWVIFVFHENTNAIKDTCVSKIAPPRLNGKKVGVFSTRSPHRPNSIGLTVVRLRNVNMVKKRSITLDIEGHDFVNDTPVLDIKPYIPYDSLPKDSWYCPDWVHPEPIGTTVSLSLTAQTQLEEIVEQQELEFYDNVKEVSLALKEMLVLDIRSVHQGRGGGKNAPSVVYQCHLDRLNIHFQYQTALHIEVQSIELIQN